MQGAQPGSPGSAQAPVAGDELGRGVEQRAAKLITEERSLRDLRQALELTQESLAERLGVNQENVSRLEQRSDLLLSTLSRYVGALGGKLSIVVEYPDRPPVALTGIRALDDQYHDPDDADFEMTSLPQDWDEPSEALDESTDAGESQVEAAD